MSEQEDSNRELGFVALRLLWRITGGLDNFNGRGEH